MNSHENGTERRPNERRKTYRKPTLKSGPVLSQVTATKGSIT